MFLIYFKKYYVQNASVLKFTFDNEGLSKNNFWHWLITMLQEKQCMLHFKQDYYMLQFVFPPFRLMHNIKCFKDFISQQLLMTDQGLRFHPRRCCYTKSTWVRETEMWNTYFIFMTFNKKNVLLLVCVDVLYLHAFSCSIHLTNYLITIYLISSW